MQVFLSYAHEDRLHAIALAKALREEGLQVWLDASELYPGDNWQLETGKALAASDAMVLLVSPEWLESEWAQREWAYAIGQERFEGHVVPVVVRPVVPDAIPWILGKVPIIAGAQGAAAPQIARAVATQLTSSSNTTLASSY